MRWVSISPLALGVAAIWLSAPESLRAQSWTSVPLVPAAGRIYDPCGSAGGLYLILHAVDYMGPSHGLWRRSWTSGVWDSLGFASVTPADVRVSGLDRRMVFLSCAEGPPRFFVSTDDGASWISKTGSPEVAAPLGVDRQVPAVIYGLKYPRRVYRSTDLGDSWLLWEGGGGAGSAWQDVTPLPLNPSVAYAAANGTWGVYILKTTNGGLSWFHDDGYIYEEGTYVARLAVTAADPDAIFMVNGRYLEETRSGVWTRHWLPATYIGRTIAIPAWAPETIYTAGFLWNGSTLRPAAYKTTDFGLTWIDMSDGLPNLNLDWYVSMSLDSHPTEGIVALTIDYPPHLLFWQEDIIAGIEGEARPHRQALRVRPNPSPGPVEVGWETGEDRVSGLAGRRVSLEISDVLGRKLRTIWIDPSGRNGRNGQSGRSEGWIRWDGRTETGAAVSPGVYFLRLEDGRSATIRVVR